MSSDVEEDEQAQGPDAPQQGEPRQAPQHGARLTAGHARVDVPADRARLAFAMETESRSAAEAADAAETAVAPMEEGRG